MSRWHWWGHLTALTLLTVGLLVGEAACHPAAPTAARSPEPAPKPVWPVLHVTPLGGRVGTPFTATVTRQLQVPPNCVWARLVVSDGDDARPIDSLWAVPALPQSRTWTAHATGSTVVSFVLLTRDMDVCWRTEHLLDIHPDH